MGVEQLDQARHDLVRHLRLAVDFRQFLHLRFRLAWISFLLTLCDTAPSLACDLCAIYRATEARASKEGWYAGAFEQFTRFGTLRENGRKVDNPTGQYMNSSITQFLLGYQVSEKFGLQLNVPYIRRTFQRPTGVSGTPAPTESGTESGLGDIALTGSFQGYHSRTEKSTFIWNLLAGIKFPTGSAARIKEEFMESEDPAGAPQRNSTGTILRWVPAPSTGSSARPSTHGTGASSERPTST